jgi:hypothetical protein
MLEKEILREAITVRSNGLTYAVFVSEDFIEDYIGNQARFNLALAQLPSKLKASPSRCVEINADESITSLNCNLIFTKKS